MRLLVGLVFLVCSGVSAGIPKVPSRINFAGVALNIKPAAQKKIQGYVNQLRKSETYHQAVVKKADLRFPLIERVFKEEGFPEDFKYLIIQETGFRADAVSKSNAVGYWQFKIAAGEEVGLKINKSVDERMNLASSSRGAARYITKNNKKLDNWVYALLSYNVGPGGVMSHFKEKDRGVKKMDVTGSMHWYVLKLLAHKVAFQNDVGKQESGTYLFIDKNQGGKKMGEIATSYGVSVAQLEPWNKWLKSKKVPTDKVYEVIVPIKKTDANIVPEVTVKTEIKKVEEVVVATNEDNDGETETESTVHDPEELSSSETQENVNANNRNYKVYINGVEGMVAKRGDNIGFLALQGGISKEEFMRFNDLKSTRIYAGQTYFFHMKKSKAKASYHVVMKGETLWDISQHYGITVNSILKKNRLKKGATVQEGQRLFLRGRRPKVMASQPVVKIGAASTLIHTVKTNETLYGISKKYGVPVDAIKKLNGLRDNTISIGQELKIR